MADPASSASAPAPPPPAPHRVKRIWKKCLHGKRRTVCRTCGGGSLCPHGKERSSCRDCGSGFCPHGKRRQNCKACGGSSICPHGKGRYQCADCQNLPCTIEGCPQFGHRFSSAPALLQHMRSKHSGQPKALTKSKELSVYKALQAAGIAIEYQKHLPFHGCDLQSETKCAFVDFAISAPWGALLLEVDEDAHSAYPASCDVRRDMDMCASLALIRQWP